MSNKTPCEPYPEDAYFKTIGLTCQECGTWECWKAYLAWEKRVCPDYAAARERGELK